MVAVFTDLDGTFLDHHTYSYEKSLPGKALLEENNIPLVMVSSKTFTEMRALHSELGIQSPFIFENGGGIACPVPEKQEYETLIMGLSTLELRERFSIVEEIVNAPCRPILDLDSRELQEKTGLPEERVLLVKERRASFPFIIENRGDMDIDKLDRANESLKKHDLMITRGGRFYHFSSVSATKGTAIEFTCEKLFNNSQNQIRRAGIGDSENDIPMFRAVDYPYLVRKSDGGYIETGIPDIIVTRGIGPEGFTEAVYLLIGKR